MRTLLMIGIIIKNNTLCRVPDQSPIPIHDGEVRYL